ncbi:hypothetical protein HYC85_028407 [Camellia sinensis]|uniref:Uncharacterized protein n=1 Tax=Camellia sinensis TaxID=4442 RepID=A0A7J7FZ37_CAMSI|nr:hypothetical protein HYC85_028407 [Camellia sinensis]
MTEINLAILSHRVGRTDSSSVLPPVAPYLGSLMHEPWCVWTDLPNSTIPTDLPRIHHDRTISATGLTPSCHRTGVALHHLGPK